MVAADKSVLPKLAGLTEVEITFKWYIYNKETKIMPSFISSTLKKISNKGSLGTKNLVSGVVGNGLIRPNQQKFGLKICSFGSKKLSSIKNY